MILDCAHYRDGARQNEGPLAIAEAAERAREDGFIWLGLHDPEEAELTEVAARFDLPPLAVEDALKAHQRPKLEDYEGSYFIVLKTARYHDEEETVHFGEIDVFVGRNYVVHVRHGDGNPAAGLVVRADAEGGRAPGGHERQQGLERHERVLLDGLAHDGGEHAGRGDHGHRRPSPRRPDRAARCRLGNRRRSVECRTSAARRYDSRRAGMI